LKNNKINNNLYINKYNKKINIKEIKKISNWSKNSFFIIKTNKGIFHQKTNMNLKIGGYLLYKIC
jgi:ribosomal protein S8